MMGGVNIGRKSSGVSARGVRLKRERTFGIRNDPSCAIKRRPTDYTFNQDNLTIVKLAVMTIVK